MAVVFVTYPILVWYGESFFERFKGYVSFRNRMRDSKIQGTMLAFFIVVILGLANVFALVGYPQLFMVVMFLLTILAILGIYVLFTKLIKRLKQCGG